MDIRQLQFFAVLADDLHFTRAAERLHVTQPTLTSQIKQLETETGLKLFERSTRQVSLTEAGSVLLQKVRRVTEAYEDVVQTAAALRQGVTGHVLLGLPTRLRWPSRYELLDLVSRRAPDISLDFAIENNTNLIDRVARGTLDVAICYGPVPSGAVRSRIVYRDHAVAVMPSTHRLADRPEVTLAELAGDPLILPSARFVSDATVVENWYSNTGIPRTVSSTNWDYDEAHSAVLKGEGIEVTPSLISGRLNVPGVAIVRIGDGEIMDVPVFVISRADSAGSASSTVADLVAASFGSGNAVSMAADSP